MTTEQVTKTPQLKWARFRFSIIGPLLASPPASGTLKKELNYLSKKQWVHPLTGTPVCFSVTTIERWFYQAKKTDDPIKELKPKRRTDANGSRKINSALRQEILQQYRAHQGWSYQLHVDNLAVVVKDSDKLGTMPSYSTIYRHMKANGLQKRRAVRAPRYTVGAMLAAERLEKSEVRSYEMEYVHSLWHLDFHHGSRKILTKDGQWKKPLLLCILDDRSRLVCHAQWYLDETTESLTHGFMQALKKRGLPRALMSDNGSAMTAAEFTQGLERLGVLHELTLPYSPYQNGKQEFFWNQIEGRLMAMLEGEAELTLQLLNEATIAWVEFEYHRKFHSEINSTPMDRYLGDKNVGRDVPDSATLRQAFCMQVTRKQRRSDGTVRLEGKRFEVSSQYRHLEKICLRYARWDLRQVFLVDAHTDKIIEPLYPLDKVANANKMRRAFHTPSTEAITGNNKPSGISPLLKSLMQDYAATGLPPAYLPKTTAGENDE